MFDHTKTQDIKMECRMCGAQGVASHTGHSTKENCQEPNAKGIVEMLCPDCQQLYQTAS